MAEQGQKRRNRDESDEQDTAKVAKDSIPTKRIA